MIEPSMISSLLVTNMSVNSALLVLLLNGKNELIVGSAGVLLVIAPSLDDDVEVDVVVRFLKRVESCGWGRSLNVPDSNAFCNLWMLFKSKRLNKSICGNPPPLISKHGIQR
jgi:hypothetical protein